MKTNSKKQMKVFLILLLIYFIMPFLTYTLIPLDQIVAGQPVQPEIRAIPGWQLGLMNGLIVLVIYGLLGLAGYWLARKINLPGIFREDADFHTLWIRPLIIGVILGFLITLGNWLFSLMGKWEGFVHPQFPLSIFASFSAGIGEEILFRLFVLSFWAVIINLVFRRWNKPGLFLWIANIIAALAFSAGHLPAVMILTNVANPMQIPPLALVEMVALNGILGLVAGRQFIKNGLVAAVGVHFWADIVWHVVLPLFLV